MDTSWSEEVPVGIVVCNAEGIVEWMNDRAARIFKVSGGMDLVGSNLMDCHPERAQGKVRQLFEKKEPYCYTVETNGTTAMLYQAPRYVDGVFKGFVEFIYTLPADIPRLDEIRWVEK